MSSQISLNMKQHQEFKPATGVTQVANLNQSHRALLLPRYTASVLLTSSPVHFSFAWCFACCSESMHLNGFQADEDAAATKIQANFRGHMQRKEVAKQKKKVLLCLTLVPSRLSFILLNQYSIWSLLYALLCSNLIHFEICAMICHVFMMLVAPSPGKWSSH